MMTVKWDSWIRNFDRSYLIDPEKVVAVFSNGNAYCKLCETYINNHQKASHVNEHTIELDLWLPKIKDKEKEKKLAANPFYVLPCEKCNKQIPRTGKRGRQPKFCDKCKGDK